MEQEKNKFIEEIKVFFINQYETFNNKCNKEIKTKIDEIDKLIISKLNTETDEVSRNILKRNIEQTETNLKYNINQFKKETISSIEAKINTLKNNLDYFLNQNKDTIKGELESSLNQINKLENESINKLNELLSFSINSINSAEKTSLYNLNKLEVDLKKEVLILKDSIEKEIHRISLETENNIDLKKEALIREINEKTENSKNIINDKESEIISNFNSYSNTIKSNLNLYEKELETQLEEKKKLFISSLEYDKQALFNEINKRKNNILSEVSQKRENEILLIENKINVLFRELTDAIVGYDVEFEAFKTTKINEYKTYVEFIFSEYKKAVKTIKNNIIEEIKQYFKEKSDDIESKYNGYIRDMLNAFNTHNTLLNDKKTEILNFLGNTQTEGLWKRILDNINDHTISKLNEVSTLTSNKKEEIETLTVLKKKEINDLRQDVIDNIGTTNTSQYKTDSSVRKKAIDSIEDIKNSTLNIIENKKNDSIVFLENKKNELAINISNQSVNNINQYINSIVPQTFYGILEANNKKINLPNDFTTRGEMNFYLDGKLLTKNIHYQIDTINKIITLNKQINYDCEYYIYEQIPIGENATAYIKGDPGPRGKDGREGKDGKSAFEIWKTETNNTNATKEDFLGYMRGRTPSNNEIAQLMMEALNNKFVTMSFEEYNSLTTKDNDKIYLVTRSKPI